MSDEWILDEDWWNEKLEVERLDRDLEVWWGEGLGKGGFGGFWSLGLGITYLILNA